MIRFECPHCGKHLKAAAEFAGMRAPCLGCRREIPVPAAASDAAHGAVAAGMVSARTFAQDDVAARRPAVPASSLWTGELASKSAPTPQSPGACMARRRLPWLVAGGMLVVLVAAATIWLLSGGGATEGYTGPPPPVEFEIKGYKVASSVAFHGRVNIKDSKIIAPRAPDGYEFTTEHPEIVLGRPHSFGWKVKSGVLFLVSCKVTVKELAPRLAEIRLIRGRQEVASLDGVAQPGFEKATAQRLNDGLAQCHKNGNTPEVSLVFRVPEEEVANPAKLSIEIRWQNQEGKEFSGRISLKHTARTPDESPKPPSGENPSTYDGEWRGRPSKEPHVGAIVIQKNTFPCLGEVRFAHKGGARFEKPDETFSFDKNEVRVRGRDDVEVVSPVEWTQKDGDIVATHTHSRQVVAKVKMCGGTLVGDATVPPGVSLFLGNADKLKLLEFKKGKQSH